MSNPTNGPKSVRSVLGATLKTYRVISPLVHGAMTPNGAMETRYNIGDQVDLTDAEAAPLLGHTVELAE